MAISPRLPKKHNENSPHAPADETAISAVINRGGSAPKTDAVPVTDPKRLQLRLYPETIEQIDAQVEKIRRDRCRPKFSRHKWLEEAIEEKLAREGGQLHK